MGEARLTSVEDDRIKKTGEKQTVTSSKQHKVR